MPNDYRLRIRLAAEADVAEATQWYNKRQLGLGEKFVREVDQAIVRILENPLAFPVILRRRPSSADHRGVRAIRRVRLPHHPSVRRRSDRETVL